MTQTLSYVLLVMVGLGAVESTAAKVDYTEDCKKVEDSARICSECEKAEHPDAVVCLTAQEMRDHVDHLEPLMRPGMARPRDLHESGIVRLGVRFDPVGSVSRIQIIGGRNPLAISVAVDAVKKWTFKPVVKKGEKRGGCGIVTIKYDFRNGGASTELQ